MGTYTTLLKIFVGGGNCRKAKSRVLGIISAWSHVLDYF
jgi:hypothetical protein